MGKTVTYSILKDIGLIIQYHEVLYSIEEASEIKLKFRQDKDYNPSFPILVDMRNTVIKLKANDLIEYGNWINKTFKSDKILIAPVKVVLLTSKPDQVAYSTIFTTNKNLKNLNYTIFSTLTTSLEWFNINMKHINTIENEIKKLSQELNS